MIERKTKVKTVLIAQPKPENDKNSYTELVKKYNLKMDFRPFTYVEGVSVKDFRKEKINIADYSAVIFTSRSAVDHFFHLCEELRFEVSAELKYFCTIESIALYLQKYIQYRKRKVFIGGKGPIDLMTQFKKFPGEKYLYPCAENSNDDLAVKMRQAKYDVTEAVMYKTVFSDLKDLDINNIDVIALFTPLSVKSFMNSFPDFKQEHRRIATFGATTLSEAEALGLEVDIKVPTPSFPSMAMALGEYLKIVNK